jgi:colanic acid/amylovoran biosynthesis protein
MTRILVITSAGKATGAWERQLGNAAILISLAQALKRHISDAEISTSIQLSENFCRNYGVTSLRHDAFWKLNRSIIIQSVLDLIRCSLWYLLRKSLKLEARWLVKGTKLREYFKAEIILDVSGDTYSDNIRWYTLAKHSVELLTMRLLGKPVLVFAASPGPFSPKPKLLLARFTLNRVTLITTREQLSNDYLQKIGVNKNLIVTTACPAFLLQPAPKERAKEILLGEGIDENNRPLIGVTLAGYNLYSYRTWDIPPSFSDLASYAPAVKYFLDDVKAQVILLPHVDRINQWTGEHIHGPDYVILKHLYQLVNGDKYNGRIKLIEGAYSSSQAKGIIGQLDLFISGRLHAGIGALSQTVPTVLLAYGHKHYGIAKLLDQERYVCDGRDAEETLSIVRDAWENRERIKRLLRERLVRVRELVNLNFAIVKQIIESGYKKKEDR